MRGKKFALVFVCLLVFACAAQEAAAQEASGDDVSAASQSAAEESPYELKRGDYEIGFWAGGSPGTTTFWGRSRDRKLLMTAFRVGRVMSLKKHFAVEMTVDVSPYMRLVQPRDRRTFFTDEGIIIARSGPDATGVGISPIGAKLLFRQRARVKPFVEARAGIVYFNQPIPYDVGRSFNYALDGGAGVQIFSRSRHATTLGYKFHHISNANTGRINPGIDSHIFYAGFSVFR